MKKIFFNAIALITVLVISTFAQSSWTDQGSVKEIRDGKYYNFTAVVVSTADTLTSKVLDLSQFDDDSFVTYPFWFSFKLSGGTTSTQKVSCQVQASYNNSTWKVIDSLLVSDSTTTLTFRSADFNNFKAPFYRLIFFGTTGNSGSGITCTLNLYAYRKD